jgi:membrane protein EpsK
MTPTVMPDKFPENESLVSCLNNTEVTAASIQLAQPEFESVLVDNCVSFRNRGRFRANVITNIVNFAIGIIVTMLLTPYLVTNLGIAAYGLIPLANTTISYLQVLLISTVGAVGRFLTIAVEQRDVKVADHVFNTALWSGLVTLLVISVPAVLVSIYASVLFSVPAGQEHNFSLLLLCAFGMFALGELGGIFSVSAFARNRLDLNNLTYIVGTGLRIGVLLLLFTFLKPSVVHVGLGLLASGACTLVGGVLVWRYLMPGLSVNIRSFDWATLRRMTGMSGWMVVTQVGTMLYLGVDLLVVNHLFGPEAGGRYGVVLMWATMLRGVAATVTSAIAPTVIALYARGNIPVVTDYIRHATRMLGLVIALPIGLVCGFASPLLRLWLGPSYVASAPLMILLTIHLCVNSGVGPLFSVNQAVNKVRVVGIVTCIGGILNLFLALLLAGPIGWGVCGVAAAGAIMLTLKNALFTPIYSAQVLGIPRLSFIRVTWGPNVALIVLVATGWLMSQVLQIGHWTILLAVFSAIAVLYSFIIYRFILTASERNIMLRIVGRET